MLKYKIWLFLGLLLFAAMQAFSQPSVGEWTDYQSYVHAKNVVDTGTKIYCVTDGGLFSYNKTDNSIQKLSGINGLSDVGVQRLAYSKENNLLLISYQNANIDLMIGNVIFNLSDIKRKSIAGDKTINNVLFVGNLAYLSCGFGIVVLNLEKKEVKDTYYIGQDGAYLNVFSMANDGTYFYAATANGIYRALVAEPNLQNYNNWVRQTNIPHSDQTFSQIINFKGKIIANYTTANNAWAGDLLYALNGSDWVSFLPEIHFVSDVTSNGNYLVFSSRDEVFVYNEKFEKVGYVPPSVFSGSSPGAARGAVIDDSSVLWVADYNNGLTKFGAPIERILPEEPIDNTVFSLTMNGNDLWTTCGGYDQKMSNLWTKPKFQLNRDGKWTVFDEKNFSNRNDFTDMVCVAVDPKNPDHVFAGSWGGGVLEFDAGKFVIRYDNFNSSLQTQLPDVSTQNAPYVRIGGMDFDSKRTLWVSNTGVANVLSSYDMVEKKWKSYNLSGIANEFTGKLVVTQNDDKWLVVPMAKGHELYALNRTNDVSKEQRLIAYFTNGKDEVYTEMNNVYSIAEDLNGELWIGTSVGVAVYNNPERIWEDKTMYATRPALNLKDSLYHPLLSAETITAIAVDGANRKWFGTKNSGVYLISAEGETEIKHFNSDNSPLPSNEIMDIAINQNTGEIFFATGAGLISYMGEAIAGNQEFNDVYVYPNPVRETYSGPIVVKGLVEDSDVKITDISGNLVYKTTSLGGQAIWDGRNLNGNRCKTGVYLVFMNDPTGDKTKVTKLLFIH